MSDAITTIIILVILCAILLSSAVRILNDWERGVVLRLGRLVGVRGPGFVLLVPIIDKMRKVDTRTVTLQVLPQEIITKDNVSIKVTAVAYFRVVNPEAAITQVVDFMYSTSQIAQTTLRSILGQHMLDELLAEQDKINVQLQRVIDTQTEPWGVKVGVVEIKDVEISSDMRRAMARQAEAERERRAKVINADGEFEASRRLTDAANIMSTNPITIQLRYLQTLLEIGAGNNTTTLFPIPLDFLDSFRRITSGSETPEPEQSTPAN